MVSVTTDPLRPLLDAACNGDDGAFAQLIRETQAAVLRVCSVLGSDGNAHDLAQETYLQVVRSINVFRGDASVQAWILSIARNVCADDVRRRQRQRRLYDKVVQHVGRSLVASGPGLSVDDLLAALEPGRREALLLTQYVGLSYEEAAAVIGCPIGTVRSRVARARNDVAAALRVAEAQ